MVQSAALPLSAPPSWAMRPVPSGYSPTIDIGRLLAALVIVLFHNGTVSGRWSETATAFFALVMIYFAARSGGRAAEEDRSPGLAGGTQRHIGRIVVARARRLLGPFAAWLGIMVAAKLAQSVVTQQPFLPELRDWLPPDGSFGHLWFLPFAFVTCVAVQSLFPRGAPVIARGTDLALAVLAVAAVGLGTLWICTYVPMPFYLFVNIFYLPTIAAAVVLAGIRRQGLMAAAAGLFCALGMALALAGLHGTPQLLYAVPLAALALLLPMSRRSWSSRLAPLSLNLYLAHMLVLSGIWMILPDTRGTWAGGVLLCLGALAVAYGLCRWQDKRLARPAVSLG